MLYLVSTPIGNIEDITFRAIRVLQEVDYILCEDTRRTAKLLAHYKIRKPLVSFNEYSEKRKTGEVVNDLKAGKDIALVSDSGSPLVSDPGFLLVRDSIKAAVSISPVPGPSALLSALVCSGKPTDAFVFRGFLPKKASKKEKVLDEAIKSGQTYVFYESPHRILKTLTEINEMHPSAVMVVAKELTKKHESFYRGTAEQIMESLKSTKGEFVLII